MNKKQIGLLAGLAVMLFLQNIRAQTKQNVQYLQQVGVLDSLYSENLKEQRKFYIQLPPSYEANSDVKYPVVFILDGEVLLPAVHNVQGFYSGGFTPEMVLVGVSNGQNRTRDLTTSKIDQKYGMPFNEENGEAETFSKFIGSELIPYIEKNYRVTSYRTLIGHSYGGLFTINTLLKHPELFSNYLAIDPSLDWDDQKLLLEAEEILQTKDYHGKSLFMSLNGQLHMQNSEVTLENVMEDTSDYTLFSRSNISLSKSIGKNTQNGMAFAWKFYPRDIHGTIAFPSIMDGLISSFEWYQMENTDKFNSPDTSKKTLSGMVNYRAKKLKDHFGYTVPPYPEELFNALGYMSMEMEVSGELNLSVFSIWYHSKLDISPSMIDGKAMVP